MLSGAVYQCQGLSGSGSHPHHHCPVVERWLTLPVWGEGGIAGVRWCIGDVARACILPVRNGALWCPPRALHQLPMPVGIFLCLDSWVRMVGEEDPSYGASNWL